MKRFAALAALLGCMAACATARARPYEAPAGRAEVGLRLGVARPLCDCSPGFGPAARVQVLGEKSRYFKLGLSVGHARFSYVIPDGPGRDSATTTSVRFLMRAYPVMGRRAGLYFDLGVGLEYATMHDSSDGTDHSTGSPTLGIGAGVPIVVMPWLRLAPYVAGLFHVSAWSESCSIATSSTSTGGSGCPGPRPAHSGFFGFGLEATALFGP